jgi:hypothetical protein
VLPSRGRVTVLIAVLLVGVIPTAYATPPTDPSWIAGYWDDDDVDTTVLFITGPCAIDVTIPVLGPPLLVVAGPVEPIARLRHPTPLIGGAHPRAPPGVVPRIWV